ncbi:hypothetical protein POM88_038686 [Heracleum sosnowskyi]|uniref:Uncharacterized protein n=1 Tax=Heracleum sosnowskyi TaxID=360622 RepID=A0AAD8H902_9APIA|nr:hypothetical protein POM88_038686 [Heracleum sosnowskyi]
MKSIGGYEESRKDDRRKKGRDKYESGRKYDDRRDEVKGRDKGGERRRDRDIMVFTPLNAPISKILHEIKRKPGFVRPARMKMPDYKKNGNKYCDYHQDKGHNTDECSHLKKLVKKMINDGELNQFVKDLRDKLAPREDKRKEPEEGERYRGEVKTISGGSTLGRDRKTTKERYAKQVYNLYQFQSAKQAMPIMFTEDDYEDVIWPHDHLIINPVIGQNKIWKVLVDGGSSLNILYHRTYNKMNLGGEQLDPCHEAPLYGFGNQPVPIEESPYNAILGRPALTSFQEVSLIPHLKLKFPTEHGIGEMRGDQKTIRITMLNDLEKDQEFEVTEGGKRKRAEGELGESRQTMNIELEKFGADLSSPIAEPAAEIE